jgi:uncharacterized protein YndB with AHSA1/START domain
MTTETGIAPVQKTISVRCSVEDAFRTFTDGVGTWWPLARHSVGGATSEVRFEPGRDGRLVERLSDGRESVWGYVLAWEPPHRLVISWHPGKNCARTQVHDATEVEVRFREADGETVVELEHRFWERLGDRDAEARSSYDGGWQTVLSRYAEEAARIST